MDGLNNGKPYCLMDDLGKPIIFGNTHMFGDESIKKPGFLQVLLDHRMNSERRCMDLFLTAFAFRRVVFASEAFAVLHVFFIEYI